MNKRGKILLLVACLAAGAAVAKTETPTAYVRELAGKAVTTDDGAVTLDTAYCFNAWDGEKPAYENLVAYLTEKGDAVRLANYTINGVAYTLNGTKNIPVAVSGAVTGVSLGGTGTLTSLSAATEKAMVINVK